MGSPVTKSRVGLGGGAMGQIMPRDASQILDPEAAPPSSPRVDGGICQNLKAIIPIAWTRRWKRAFRLNADALLLAEFAWLTEPPAPPPTVTGA